MQAIDPLTVNLVSAALDAATLRQQVIAANIANAGRPDYVAQRVSFEAALDRQRAASTADDAGRLDLRARITPDLDSNGAARPVQLDAEVGALSLNALHYQALIRGLNRYLSLLSSAVSDGKR